jgi:hypothetical protein
MIPQLIAALNGQKPTELKTVKAAMEKPYDPGTETFESWLTSKTRLAALATTHLRYTFNDSDIVLSVWSGLAHLHLDSITTFKRAWTTTNRLPAERTFALLSAAILVWERDMVESEQSVFEPTRASAGYSATSVPTAIGAQTALKSLLSGAKVAGLGAEDSALMKRFVEAGLATIAHKQANPDFVVPPHACVTHGMCFHTAGECKSKPK